MEKKRYINPSVSNSTIRIESSFMDSVSLPNGGDGGPGIAEGKERDEEEYESENEDVVNVWGDLW